MGVTNIYSGQSMEKQTSVASGGETVQSARNDAKAAALFEEGMRNALEQAEGPGEGQGNNAARTEEEQYPLEAYRIPNWYADLWGGFNEVSCTIGASWEEAQTKYARLSRPEQKLYDEYAHLLTTYYHEACDEAGVSFDIGEYYHNFLQDPAKQVEAREALYSRLAEDPRAVELMEHFGITI